MRTSSSHRARCCLQSHNLWLHNYDAPDDSMILNLLMFVGSMPSVVQVGSEHEVMPPESDRMSLTARFNPAHSH